MRMRAHNTDILTKNHVLVSQSLVGSVLSLNNDWCVKEIIPRYSLVDTPPDVVCAYNK